MTRRLVAHVVRSYGGLTEPFITQRITAENDDFVSELWYETTGAEPPEGAHRVDVPLIAPDTYGSRIFHRVPAIGPPLANAYRRLEARRRPALIHAHYATTGFLVGAVTDAPLIVSTYGFDMSAMARRPAWRWAFRRLAARAAAVLVEGPHMAARVVSVGFPASRVRLVRIGAQMQDVAYVGPEDRHGASVRLLACGRLVEKKGHEVAIRAFAALAPELGSDAVLEIVGGGPRERRLRSLVDRLGLAAQVQFLGALPRTAYLELLRTATLLLAPSVTALNGDSEGGAPTTILDAQASGTILVASDHADIPFLVTDGQTGFLCREGDPDALAVRIRDALAERARWPTVARSARENVLDLHADRPVTEALVQTYREVLDG